MKKERNICVILGSGFSKPAGLPLAYEIDAFFNRNNVGNLLQFSSGEWKWLDRASDADRTNGSFGFHHIAYSYILNELVNSFIKENASFTNYEEFYQFVIDGIKNKSFLKSICKKAFMNSKKENIINKDSELYENHIFAFTHPDSNEIHNLLNYLIDDLLYWHQPFENFEYQYLQFLSFIKAFKRTNIITFNHDLLLEALFQQYNIEFSDGFSKTNSPLQSEKGEKILTFNGNILGKTALIKLHGSIDLYKYNVSIQKDSFLTPTGEYIYFKTHNYYDKHTPIRVNPVTNEVVQSFHWNITPQFITGTRKNEIITHDYMYSKLYSEFEKRIHNSDVLLIIGYSYGDEHVNNQIKSAIKKTKVNTIINVNPSMGFPFDTNNSKVINYKSILEIN